MRLRVVGLVVVLGALLVACGGGGKSGVMPSITQPIATASTPAGQATKRMTVVLRIPPASQQSKARRPYYISPNTQSIAFAVLPNGSGTPNPSELQIFPVTTPSPCATPGGGGSETCTFTVSAPYGTDTFYVATFAVASPVPASSPLANFVSGAIVIASPSAGPTPTPLAFTLNGVVNSVAITVPSPDPNNTPNTQVFVAAVPTSVSIGITPYDASGAPILTDTFGAPITINIAPANDGVGLTLSPTCSGSTGSATPSPTINIGCAADLANAGVSYGGTITADSSDHIIDAFAIAAQQGASPAPSPANVVLASNVTSLVPSNAATYNTAYLQALPNNVIAYLLANPTLTTAEYGTIDVATNTFSTPITLNGTTPTGFYTMSDGSIWISDSTNLQVQCFAPGSTSVTSFTSLASTNAYLDDVTFDGSSLWVSGYMGTGIPYTSLANYAPLSSQCTVGSFNSVALTGNQYADGSMLLAPQSGGGVLIDGVGTGGAWTVSSGGTATALNPGFTAGSGFGGGVGIDGTGTGYFGFYYTGGQLFTLANGATSFGASPLTLATTLGGLAAFGPNGGSADRIGVADTTNQTLLVIEGPNGASPIQILTTLGHASFASGQNVAISTGGAGYVAFRNQNTSAMNIARTYFTTTWSIPVTTLPLNNVLSIDERGDSGPFTLTPVGTPPACLSTITAVPNTDHDFYVHTVSGPTCVVTLKATDKNGRSQTVTVTAQFNAG